MTHTDNRRPRAHKSLPENETFLSDDIFKSGAAVAGASLLSSLLPPSAAIGLGIIGAGITEFLKEGVSEEDEETKKILELASKASKTLVANGAINGVVSHIKKERH